MSIDPGVLRRCLDALIEAVSILRDHFASAEQAAAKEKRMLRQVELAALRDLAAADTEPK